MTEEVTVQIRPYDASRGVTTWWDEEAILCVEVDNEFGAVVISGNPAGLRSLARHLLTLAHTTVPDGRHLDFDTYGGHLTESSRDLRLEVEK